MRKKLYVTRLYMIKQQRVSIQHHFKFGFVFNYFCRVLGINNTSLFQITINRRKWYTRCFYKNSFNLAFSWCVNCISRWWRVTEKSNQNIADFYLNMARPIDHPINWRHMTVIPKRMAHLVTGFSRWNLVMMKSWSVKRVIDKYIYKEIDIK